MSIEELVRLQVKPKGKKAAEPMKPGGQASAHVVICSACIDDEGILGRQNPGVESYRIPYVNRHGEKHF